MDKDDCFFKDRMFDVLPLELPKVLVNSLSFDNPFLMLGEVGL